MQEPGASSLGNVLIRSRRQVEWARALCRQANSLRRLADQARQSARERRKRAPRLESRSRQLRGPAGPPAEPELCLPDPETYSEPTLALPALRYGQPVTLTFTKARWAHATEDFRQAVNAFKMEGRVDHWALARHVSAWEGRPIYHSTSFWVLDEHPPSALPPCRVCGLVLDSPPRRTD